MEDLGESREEDVSEARSVRGERRRREQDRLEDRQRRGDEPDDDANDRGAVPSRPRGTGTERRQTRDFDRGVENRDAGWRSATRRGRGDRDSGRKYPGSEAKGPLAPRGAYDDGGRRLDRDDYSPNTWRDNTSRPRERGTAASDAYGQDRTREGRYRRRDSSPSTAISIRGQDRMSRRSQGFEPKPAAQHRLPGDRAARRDMARGSSPVGALPEPDVPDRAWRPSPERFLQDTRASVRPPSLEFRLERATMAEDREDFSDGTRPPRGPRANRLGHPETRPLSTEDRADCAPVGSAKVVHDKPNAGADTPREPRRDRERNLSERPSEGAVVASNNPQPQSRRKRSPRSRSGKLTSPISSSDELPAKRQRSRIDRDAWGSQYYDDGPEGDLAKHADDRSGGTDQLLPSPRSGWRQDRRFRPNKGSRDNSEADFIASATRPYDRYEPVADRDWSDGKNLFDSVAASNRDSSRPQRSPSRGGRVLNRKEGSHYRGMGQPLRGEPPDQEARPMQAVRGSGWKTVQAPARSSGKLGRSPADSAGVKGGVNGSNRSRLSHDSEQSCQADNRPPGSGTRSAALPHPSSAGPHLDLPADSRTDSLPSSSSAHPRAGTNPDEEREIAAPGSRSKCERRDDNGEQRLDLPQVEAGEGYVRIGQVGEGTYGQVFKARSDRTGVLVALKKIRMEAEKDGFPITAMREIKLLQELRHENIVRLHEMMVARSSVYMVFEYMEHDLNGILAHPEIQFSPAHFKSLSAQLFSGLAYLHRKSVLHRDLKGSNILINNQGLLKLADFGLARFYMKRRRGDYTNRVVTLWYRPPELLFGATQYGPEVDMWGAGCIFLELFTKRPAFPGNTEVHQLQVISDILGPITEQRWPGARKLPWFELVKPTEGTDGTATSAAGGDELNVGSVHTSPKPEGSYFDDAFSSWLPPSALEVARRLLSYDPLLRLSAADALEMDYFGEAPRAEMPAGLLSGIEGEWHEFESRRARKKSNKRAPDTAQADAPAAHMQARSAAMGTGDDRLPEPADA